MELYELTIDDKVDEVYAVSLVENPAIESDFIFFGKEKIQFASVDTEQRMLIGPVLIPDKKILRVDGEGKPYNVFLSKETVKKVAQNYLMKKYTDNATLEHDKKIKGVSLVESWIKDSKLDKSNSYGLNLPEGTWVGMFKITDDKLWNDYIKTGVVKGFSIEGLFSHKLIKASMIDESILEKEITQLTEEEALVVLKKLKYSIKSDKRFKSGKTMLEETHSDYPDGVKSNAKKALEYANTNGWGSCGTPVGKQRANQLAKGEPISVDTIKRMYSFLSRHEGDLQSSTAYGDGCGKLMYDAWGGKAALGWSRNKLRELGLLNENEGNPSISNSSYAGQPAGYVSPATLDGKTLNLPKSIKKIFIK
jgi:hypothetical protein